MKAKDKVGYSFWGYLGDVKYGIDRKEASTPDGNAFYSWSIIRELQRRGHEVSCLMPNRDGIGFDVLKDKLFTWAKFDRLNMFYDIDFCFEMENDFSSLTREEVFAVFDDHQIYTCKFILHEWRMLIPGRNDEESRSLGSKWQPDFFIQECLFDYCAKHHIVMFVFDLDYKIDENFVRNYASLSDYEDVIVLELGDFWDEIDTEIRHYKVSIPFDFNHMNDFDVKKRVDKSLVYIGNRYERDWCIDKYIGDGWDSLVVYGNWLEAGRDSRNRWPKIDFRGRLQTCTMRDVYSSSACTVLLAKESYCKYHFMTARILEALFYGAVPLFIEEYGKETIKKYSGIYSDMLTVHSKEELEMTSKDFMYDYSLRKGVIENLRKHLNFMDVTNFVDCIEKEMGYVLF